MTPKDQPQSCCGEQAWSKSEVEVCPDHPSNLILPLGPCPCIGPACPSAYSRTAVISTSLEVFM